MNRAAALAAVLLAAGAARAADVPEPPELLPARLYLEGRRDEALTALLQRHPAVLELELDALRHLDIHDRGAGALARAALMLHTDRAWRQRLALADVGLHCGPRDEDTFARLVAALLTARPDSRDYARRFFVATARRSLEALCLADVRGWTRAGLKWFPGDAELLLAEGTAAETAAVFGRSMALAQLRARLSDEERPDARRELERARDTFERALAADPSLLEARLRLGHALSRLGKHELARGELERVASAASAGEMRYLCQLFLARVHDASGRRAEAARAYREALAAAPAGQAAAIGLAQLLGRDGDGRPGRAVLTQSVAHAPRQGARDPYWSYPAGLDQPGDAALDALRAEIAP